jgi:hypothetical protein
MWAASKIFMSLPKQTIAHTSVKINMGSYVEPADLCTYYLTQ